MLEQILFIISIISIVVIVVIVAISMVVIKNEEMYRELENEVLSKLQFKSWNVVSYYDDTIIVKSRQTLEKYDYVKYFKENKSQLENAKVIVEKKTQIVINLKKFLRNNEFKENKKYPRIVCEIRKVIARANAYRILVKYISSAGNHLGTREILVRQQEINKLIDDPCLLMSKGEYSQYIKERERAALNTKQHQYYEIINKIIDFAINNRSSLFLKGSVDQLDDLITNLYDRTIDSIKKIKNINSDEWKIIDRFLSHIEGEITKIVNRNFEILNYYESSDFFRIKETCETLMSKQREFNEYIAEKVSSISNLFGARVTRNETIIDDEYQYIRPYKKTINPFTAEVSAGVFSSAENSPLDYIIKYFYSNKNMYSEQIQKLHLLIEELATLKEAKSIIDNYKKEYQKYLKDVPSFIMEEDEIGFYTRLGFANIDDSVLVVEYKFSYTSSGGMAKRKFTVPMTEENIVELIKMLEGKLTISAFTKEQRVLMTHKLRDYIKERDDFTCCSCGNSIYKEPNLLLEIDHIIPVSKGGYTVEENLQTLCWKCNRAKSNKIVN